MNQFAVGDLLREWGGLRRRSQRDLALGAGVSPRFSERSLDDPEMQPNRSTLRRLLDAHDPYQGVVIDRQ